MPTYAEWNQKLLEYITSGLPRGSRVYLSIDDEALQTIGESFGLPPLRGQTWANDFEQAVQSKCVLKNQVHLDRVFAPGLSKPSETPRYLGFLSAMALAAHRMQFDEENEIENTNYLLRLNQILGVNSEGRLPGLKHGVEEKLWDDWADWLRANGYLPSAKMTGRAYITLAISQALLRNSDKDALWNYFATHNFASGLLKDDLMELIRIDALRSVQGITKHLQRLIKSDGEIGAQRYDDLAQTLADVYNDWVLNGKQQIRSSTGRSVSPHSIIAGLYRQEDPISGQRFYYIFPRQPRHVQLHNARIYHEGEEEWLTEDRPGWFSPLWWPVRSSELHEGFSINIEGGGTVERIVLQPHEFWVLTPDIDDPESGVYASWEQRPELGVPFVLLCRADLRDQIRHLKNEGLIDWKEEKIVFDTEDGSWIEYYGITVISDAWKGVNIQNRSLYQQLYPQQAIGISISGGLRDPRSSAWIEGFGPTVTVYSFDEENLVEITDVASATLEQEINGKTGEPVDLGFLKRGIYRLQISSGNAKPRSREIRIQSWDSLMQATVDHRPPLNIVEYDVFGARITLSST